MTYNKTGGKKVDYDMKKCANCLFIEHRCYYLVCIINDKEVSVDDVCSQWEPDESTELIMLRKENAELKKQNWVSTKDKLPIDRAIVYCVDGYITIARIVNRCVWDDMFSWHDEMMWQFDHYERQPLDFVTHWMELPDNPKDGDNDE